MSGVDSDSNGAAQKTKTGSTLSCVVVFCFLGVLTGVILAIALPSDTPSTFRAQSQVFTKISLLGVLIFCAHFCTRGPLVFWKEKRKFDHTILCFMIHSERPHAFLVS